MSFWNTVFLFLRFQANGNYLFSVFSISMCRDKVDNNLRVLTAIELHLISCFCSKHLFFVSLISKHSKLFISIGTILPMLIMLSLRTTYNVLNCNKTREELVQNESISICSSFKWVGFLYVLRLPSGCSSSVQCYCKSTYSLFK